MNEGAAGREELGEEVGVTLSTKMYHGQPFSSHNMNAGALEDKYATAVNQRTKARTACAAKMTSFGESSKAKERLSGQIFEMRSTTAD